MVIKNWLGEVIKDGLDCQSAKDGMTIQSEAHACDINNIVKQQAKGKPILVSDLKPVFGDFSNIPDFQEAMTKIAQASQAFDEMPWQVRERFQNDPVRLVEFLQDPKNQNEAIDLGLAIKVPSEVPSSAAAPASEVSSSVPKA